MKTVIQLARPRFSSIAKIKHEQPSAKLLEILIFKLFQLFEIYSEVAQESDIVVFYET